MEALGRGTVVYDDETSKAIVHDMCAAFPITMWARIDWDLIVEKQDIVALDMISGLLSRKWCYVIWDDGSLPVVKANVQSIIENIDDVTAVSFDTWLCDLEFQKIVEFYHEGEVRFGHKNKDV